MNEEILKILKKENKEVISNIIIYLIQSDPKNELRILEIYTKYK